MTPCPRCGAGLRPAATVCTACCHPLDDNTPNSARDRYDVVLPDRPDPVIPHSLMHWPFGGADAETVRAVAQASTWEGTRALDLR